ncbi:DegQ family serine endoprotease [soil metagenome]
MRLAAKPLAIARQTDGGTGRGTAWPALAAAALALALAVGAMAPANSDTAGPGNPPSFADLAAMLSPAVVNITTSTTVADVQRGPRPVVPEGSPFEEFFRDFFDRGPGGPGTGPESGPESGRPDIGPESGPQAPRQRRSNALGSGFIISPDGYIVTNNHVIDTADEVRVELYEGGELDARVIGRDPRTDIALLKVEADRTLPFVSFGDSDAARVGDWVIAIGNPLGQGFSVSAGIVSARNRPLQGSYDDFIQTDAAINRGNSGGPLFNMAGEVVGVNTAILSPTGGSIGIGFAMSSAVVTRVIDQLQDFGETRRGWLGVRIQNVDPDVAEALGLEEVAGALITDVPEGPAAEAGMRAGDVILEFDGNEVPDTRILVRIVADTEVGRTVDVVVYRDGERQTLAVDIGRLEEATLAAAPGGVPQDAPAPREETLLGMTLAAVTGAHRERFALSQDTRGVILLQIDEGSDAYDKGMRTGDVITEVGQEAVASPRDVRTRIEAAEEAGRNSVLLLVRRDGQPRFVALNLSN